MHYSIALLPPPHVSKPLAAVRAAFDPEHASKTMPHVTLKQPFACAEPGPPSEALLFQGVAAACARQPAFPVRLNRVGAFESPRYGCVVYYGVDPCDPLMQLSRAMVEAMRKLGHVTDRLTPDVENRLFFPHLTLAQGLSTQAADQAMRTLSVTVRAGVLA